MSLYYKILYFLDNDGVTSAVGYTDSFYLHDRIDDLAERGVCKGWKVDMDNPIPKDQIRDCKELDGGFVNIDARWGLIKKRRATAGLMARLNELWVSIEMHNVYRITYRDASGDDKIGYTNSDQLINTFKLIVEYLPERLWACMLIPFDNEDQLKRLQYGNGRGCGRHIRDVGSRFNTVEDTKSAVLQHDDDDDEDENLEGGDDGWCTTELLLIYPPLGEEAIERWTADEKANHAKPAK